VRVIARLVDRQEPVDEAVALADPASQLAAPGAANGGQVLQPERAAGELCAQRARESVVVKHADLGEIARVIADHDRFADMEACFVKWGR
jgi:hypothetical protein